MAVADDGSDQDQLEEHGEAYYDARAQANGAAWLRQFGDEGLTLANLSERAILSTRWYTIVCCRSLAGRSTKQPHACLCASRLRETLQAVAAGVTEGAALIATGWLWCVPSMNVGCGIDRPGCAARGYRAARLWSDPAAGGIQGSARDVPGVAGLDRERHRACIFKVDVVRQQQPVRRSQTNRSDNGAGPADRAALQRGYWPYDPCWCGSGRNTNTAICVPIWLAQRRPGSQSRLAKVRNRRRPSVAGRRDRTIFHTAGRCWQCGKKVDINVDMLSSFFLT